jgi:hypothetical protein
VPAARVQVAFTLLMFALGYYGIFPLTESSLLVDVKHNDRPSGIGTSQDNLAKYGFALRSSTLC